MYLLQFSAFLLSRDHYPLVDCAEQCCPVNGMIIAQIAVVSDIDVPALISFKDWNCRSDALLLEDKQGKATKGREGKNETTVIVFWP